MRQLVDFHHYSRAAPETELTRVERLERRVIATLLEPSSLPDEERESSVAFELKHSSGTLQFARALARKREIAVDTAAAGALLHDIYVIEEGQYKDHAALGAPIARQYMEEVGGFTEEEISNAVRLVESHSDKHIWSGDPYAEFGKDVDVLDCFLYPGAFDYYLLHKPFEVFFHYLTRAKRMWSDLNLPPEPIHTILDEYEPGAWMPVAFSADRVPPSAGAASASSLAPYAIFGEFDTLRFRAPRTARTEPSRIVAHAEGVIAQVRGADARPPILVFPALERWTPLSDPAAIAELGDEDPAVPRFSEAIG